MRKEIILIAPAVITLLLSSQLVLGIFYPESHIEEKVTSEYNYTGKLLSEEREGKVKVFTKNNILQDVQVNLSGQVTSKTNLISRVAYRRAVASVGNQKVKLFLKTDESDKELSYDINPSVTPNIDIKVEYENEDGGKDIHSDKNTFDFRITLESSKDMDNVNFDFIVPTDTGPNGEDSFNLKNPVASKYDAWPINSDGGDDDDNEEIEWEGNLTSGEELVIAFEGEITPGENLKDNQYKIDLTKGEYKARDKSYLPSNTFTRIGFGPRFARGSVRNGVHLTKTQNNNWIVRGFFKNKANNLRYEVNGWNLYRLGNETPLISYYPKNPEYIRPEKTLYTDSFSTDKGKKKYFLSSFDWDVDWGETFRDSSLESTIIEMPTLYVITSWLYKHLDLEKNDKSGRRVRVKDVLSHTGSKKLDVTKGRIYSKVPHLSKDGTFTNWTISQVNVFYRNKSAEESLGRNITNKTNITTKLPTENSDGYVLAKVRTEYLKTEAIEKEDDLILKYYVSSDSKKNDEEYTFKTKTTLWTESGTPENQTTTKTLLIPGITIEEKPEEEVPTGGMGGVAPAKKMIELEPEETRSSIITGNLVNVKRTDRVIDTGNKGARELNPQILLPKGGTLQPHSLKIKLYRKNKWEELAKSNYTIEDEGVKPVEGKKYHLYNVRIKREKIKGLTLYDEDKISISYRARVKFGKNEIITRLSGYNYYEDRYFIDDSPSMVRVGWELQSLKINKKRWKQREAIVGEPVKWEREIYIENPNNVSVKKVLRIFLPDGTFSCFVNNESLEVKSEVDGNNYVEWEFKAKPLLERKYIVKAYTSPVILIGEDIQILKSKEVWAKFLLNNTFENTGVQKYKRVYRMLPIEEKMIQSAEMNGKDIKYFGKNNQTKIKLGNFKPQERKSISVIYKEYPPILEVTPDSFNYTRRKISNISVLVVGKKDQTTGYVDLQVIGPMPERKEVYSDVLSLKGKGTKEFLRSIDLKPLPPGNYSVRATFRKDFTNIITERTHFWVTKKRRVLQIEDWYLSSILILVIILVGMRIYKKKERYKERVKNLKKKINKTFK